MKVFKKFIPLIVIAILIVAAYLFGVQKYFTYDALVQYHKTLKSWVTDHPFTSPLIFMGIYIVSTALSLPGGAILSIICGYLFIFPLSSLYVVVAATIGASIIFLAAKTAVGDLLKRKAGPLMQKMATGFEKNASLYLLFLRFVSLFPFWLVNLAPAFFGVRLRTFVWTTFVGIIPGTLVFTYAGYGLEAIFASDQGFSVSNIFNIKIRIALALLGVFALLPIFLKKVFKKKFGDTTENSDSENKE